MEIEHVDGVDQADALRKAIARLKAMSPPELLAQQCMLAGAFDALAEVIKRDVTKNEVEAMLASTAYMLGLVAGTAKERGIVLPQFVPKGPGAGAQRKTH